jgi:hypothetical protein
MHQTGLIANLLGLGYFIADYRSAAAAGAVYGAVNMFLAIWFSHLVVDEV